MSSGSPNEGSALMPCVAWGTLSVLSNIFASCSCGDMLKGGGLWAGGLDRPSLLYIREKIAFCKRFVMVGISRGCEPI